VDINSKIYVAGHTGMVGSALVRRLKTDSYFNFFLKTHEELDLLDQNAVNKFFATEKPDYVFIAAATVGGIQANNTYRGQFLYENLMIQSNIIHAAHQNGVKKLMFLGSACIYPRNSKQPLKEEYLLSGYLESTNEPYAIAKIAGIKMCENYYKQYGDNNISVMPNNLYGTNDNFDLKNSHVLPALIRKFHEAKINNEKSVEIWGSGKPKREFLHVEDLADACIFLMKNLDADKLYSENISHINIGSGEEVSINELALLIKDIVGFEGELVFNINYPDGTPRKLLDVTRLRRMGWESKIKLNDGLASVYKWYLDTCAEQIL
jgi:GDP-L-fucose synthase